MAANYADQYNNGEIEEVFPRIWRVPVPLPDNPLNYLNSYFILSDDKTTIVDVGFDHPDCEKALDDALRKVREQKKIKQIQLLPFMFVAGDHAKNDIAGDIKTELESQGYQVSVLLEGLGQNPGIQDIFIEHAKFMTQHKLIDISDKKKAYAADKE